jgi:hypothetical protein
MLHDLEISYSDSDETPNDQPSLYLARVAPVERPTTVSEDWSKPVVNAGSLAVIAQEQGLLATVGLKTDRSDLFFDEGTAFMAIGHANAVAERARLDALPDLESEIASFKATIKAENRRDSVVEMTEFRLNSVGNLDHASKASGHGGAVLSEVAWRQLAAACGSQNLNKGLSGRTRMLRRVRARDLKVPSGE